MLSPDGPNYSSIFSSHSPVQIYGETAKKRTLSSSSPSSVSSITTTTSGATLTESTLLWPNTCMMRLVHSLEEEIQRARVELDDVTFVSNHESHQAHLIKIERKFEMLKQEHLNHLKNDCRAAIRTMTPSPYSGFELAPESPYEDQLLDVFSCSGDDTEYLAITLEDTNEEKIVVENEISGFARCRLCQVACYELKRTNQMIVGNHQASVICQSCFKRLVPPLMSMKD